MDSSPNGQLYTCRFSKTGRQTQPKKAGHHKNQVTEAKNWVTKAKISGDEAKKLGDQLKKLGDQGQNFR